VKIQKTKILLFLLFVSIGIASDTNVDTSTEIYNKLMYHNQVEVIPSYIDSLPSNMPVLTKLLWGRHGLVRTIKLAPNNRIDELKLRRNMLQWHQRLGLVTLVTLMTQVTIGKQLYDNPAETYDKYSGIHKNLGYTTYGLYLSTASMSLLAPPARKYSKKFYSIKIHRMLAVVHFSAMIIQPWLASKAVNNPSKYDYYIDLHNQVGTIAALSFSLAFLSTLLP